MEEFTVQDSVAIITLESTPPPSKPQPPPSTIITTPPTPTSNTIIDEPLESAIAEEVEIQIQYSFIRKVRLPKGFTKADLEGAAAKQTVPVQVEFR
jgi:hypothetical protein